MKTKITEASTGYASNLHEAIKNQKLRVGPPHGIDNKGFFWAHKIPLISTLTHFRGEEVVEESYLEFRHYRYESTRACVSISGYRLRGHTTEPGVEGEYTRQPRYLMYESFELGTDSMSNAEEVITEAFNMVNVLHLTKHNRGDSEYVESARDSILSCHHPHYFNHTNLLIIEKALMDMGLAPLDPPDDETTA